MLEFKNNTGFAVSQLNVAFDYEKFRTGTRTFDMTFFHGGDGSTWNSSVSGAQTFAGDGNTGTSTSVSINKTFSLTGLNIANGTNYYFRWNLAGDGGSSSGQAIGIDNFSLTAAAVPEPSSMIYFGLLVTWASVSRRKKR